MLARITAVVYTLYSTAVRMYFIKRTDRFGLCLTFETILACGPKQSHEMVHWETMKGGFPQTTFTQCRLNSPVSVLVECTIVQCTVKYCADGYLGNYHLISGTGRHLFVYFLWSAFISYNTRAFVKIVKKGIYLATGQQSNTNTLYIISLYYFD